MVGPEAHLERLTSRMSTGRFAPNLTGALHVGNLRTALVAWLFSRSSGGRFFLRIQDLVPLMASYERARAQLSDLRALGIDWDGPVTYQSERLERYRSALERLQRAELVYPCYCTYRDVLAASEQCPDGPDYITLPPRRTTEVKETAARRTAVVARHASVTGPLGSYPGTCRGLSALRRAELEASGRRPCLRVRAGGVAVTVDDRLAGSFTSAVDDFVVRRTDGTPAYPLAVVLDDADEGVELVVRGGEVLPSTPRQVWLAHVLALPIADHAHVPLVYSPNGEPLAKRNGAASLADLRAADWEPRDVLSVIAASLGLAEPGEPVHAAADLLDRFDPDRLPHTPWVFDVRRGTDR